MDVTTRPRATRPSETGAASVADEPAGTLAERVRGAAADLAPSEARVLEALLEPGAEILNLSVSEVAAAAGVGVATVVRACQSLGFKGFQAAKIALAQDLLPLGERPREDIDPSDTVHQVLAKLAASNGQALSRVPMSVGAGALADAVEALHAARRVLFRGVGTSAPIAADGAFRLATIGVPASFPPDVHTQHVQARLLGPDDVAVAVSHTGATHETVGAARGAHAAGAAVIAITSFHSSPLTEVATTVLVAGSRKTRYQIEAMTSRLAHLLVLESLFIALLLRNPDHARIAQTLAADALDEHCY
ncbi:MULTISPECIES: MurR/RpiR family transcriptional regulator, partial [unclassified Frankia]